MAKGFTPIIGLAVVVALALAAVFGAMSLTNPAFAQEDTRPPGPTGLTVTAVTASSVTVTWTAQDGYEDDHYEVRSFLTDNNPTGDWLPDAGNVLITPDDTDDDVDVPANMAVVPTTGDAGEAQTIQVRTTKDNVNSIPSSIIGIPRAAPTVNPIIGTAAVDPKKPGEVVLTWTPAAGADFTDWQYLATPGTVRDTSGASDAAAYEFTADPNAKPEFTDFPGTVTGDGTTDNHYKGTITGLGNVAYVFQVRARNGLAIGTTASGVYPAAENTGAVNSDDGTAAVAFMPPPKPREEMGPTFESTSDTPGSVGRYEFNFDIPDETNTLIHDLIIELEDYNIPGEVGTASVTITIDDGDGNPRNDYTFTPEDVSVDGEELFISIGDVTEDTGTGGSKGGDDQVGGVYNVGGPNERMKVVFRKSAGIKNPSAADSYFANIAFGENKYDYDDLKKPDDLDVEVLRKVSLSSDKGGLGKKVTATGKGFEDGTSLTFFVDKYVGEGVDSSGDRKMGQDGILNSGEDVVCRDPEVDGDNIGTCEFTVYSPTFVGGKNYVNAIDGLGDYSELAADDEDHEFKVQASMQATPSGGSPGEIMLIQLVNFGYQADVNQVLLSGQPICDDADADARDCGYNTDNLGTADFKVEIPNWAIGGKQDLKVVAESSVDGEVDANTTVDISGPVIRVTPKEVVANQRISLIGTGFVAGARVCCGEAGSGDETDPLISIGGDVIDDSRINGGQHVRVDNGGNWSASVDLPLNESTTGDGERVIRITDSQGRTGAVVVSIPAREVTITPDTGRVGTLAVVRGKYFPSKNDEGNSFNIEIVYDAVDGRTTVSASPDAGGSFEQQIRIPTTADIPSTNTVKVSYEDGAGVVVVTAVTHSVPEGVITLSDTSGGPGSSVTINGEGFKSFVPIASVSIGSLDVTPAPKPSTDGNGMMSFPITIPGLDVGIQTIEVDVGRTVASVGFTVTESGINPGNIRPIGPALEDLGDNFVNVWHFNNDTKLWSFYDGMEGSDLTHLITGETYLMQIKSTMEVILNGDTRNLTCVGSNCWNQIVW